MSEGTMSMTPPLTPPVEKGEVMMDSDSLDYMDFFISELNTSPAKEERVCSLATNDGPLLFSCMGEVRWTENISNMSCVGQEVLAQLLRHINPCPTALLSSEVIFNLPCTQDNLHLNLAHFFTAVRQGVTQLERGAQSGLCMTQSCHDVQYPKIRQDIATFLNCLVSYVHTLGCDDNEEFLHSVVAEVLDMLLYLGPLHELPEHVTSASSSQGNKCPSAAYHLLHLHLDVRWWSLVLLHLVESAFGFTPQAASHSVDSLILVSEPQGPQGGASSELIEHSPIEECISMVVWDLITVMLRKGLKSVSDLYQVAGFSCTCSLEMGLMTLHLLDHRHAHHGKKNYWEQIKRRLLVLLKVYSESSTPSTQTSSSTSSPSSTSMLSSEQNFQVIQYPAAIVKGAQLPHIWWIFYNFSQLYGYDMNGKKIMEKSIEIKSETKLLRTLIKLSLGEPKSGSQPTEAELRFYVRCCFSLSQLWGGEKSSEWAVALWDYFSKHLDSSFLLPGAGLEGLACVSKTASGWLEQVRSRTCNLAAIGKSETSWQIFLRIVVGVVETSPAEWRQVRGRIYSKFHGRKMSELSPLGLYNSSTLFLTLANTTDLVGVSNKLGELLYMVPTSSVSKSRIVWRGYLATMLLLLESGCDISPVVKKFSPILAATCHEYITSRDSMHRRDLGQLITIYADGVQEVFDQSFNLTLSQHSLICGGLSGVLQHASSIEMKAILGASDTALTKVIDISSKPQYLAGLNTEIVDVIWREFGSFIKSHATTLTPPAVLGTVAASLTFCLGHNVSNPTSGNKEAALGLFTYFTTNDAVNPLSTLQYVSSLLEIPGSISMLSDICSAYEGHLISGWLSSLIIMGNCDEAIALTPKMMSLPGVAEVLHRHPPACPFAAAKCLAEGVAKKYSETQIFTTRVAFRDAALQYFSGLDKALGILLKKVPPPDHLSSVLEMVADLFFHAHSIIYIKSRVTCPMPGLISTLLLPSAVYEPEKPLNSHLALALANTLPKMVCAMGCLGLAQDPYLVRCVRNVFTHYMYRFPVKTSNSYTSTTHPFIICLHNGDVREEAIQELRSVFLEVVRDSYLRRRGVSNVHLQMVISLVLELLNKSTSEWMEGVCCTLFLPLLELLLTLEEPTTKRVATDLLQKLLQEVRDQDTFCRSKLVRSVRRLVIQHLSWSSAKLFRVLGVIGVLHKQLIVECLPHIAQAVTATEEKRGIGLDHTLRHGYQALLASLGVNEEDIIFA
ncbi:protein MMS22-like isoform X2 [Homarus americanus]|uniref:protein MMS22-like isoform X2 n=1 Tax=Homarus americanus TaxID=6706 RepID=UPI001C45EBCF|nr:protein MMS22-like isoform X2 [Homarus americanus]